MISHIIKWSINNRFLVILGTLFFIVWGGIAVKKIPLDAIPDLSDVQVIIKTSYAGQAPQVVEDQVTYPLTTAMLSVPGAVNVRGYSFFGDSYVYIIFEDGTDLYWARSRVLEYLSQVSSKLPASVTPALGPDATGVGWVYEYALVDRTGKYDLSELRSIQDWFLKFELQTVEGVAEVATIGGMVKQYQVVVHPNKLRAYNIPLQKIHDAIKNANMEVGGSVIEMAEAEYMVRSGGYLKGINDLKTIPLGLTKTGTPILLGEIANITLGPQMRRGVSELNGEGEVVGGVLIMRWGGNALQTIKAVKSKMETLKNSLPAGVEVITVYDRSSLIERAVNSLEEKLLEEFIVVIILPIGILMAFIIMEMQGINANIMSLGGIAIAIGAMVDAAIVMIENYHKHLEDTEITKENRWDIVYKSCSEVGSALFFFLIIITMSFIPVFTLEAQEGRMFAPLAYTKTYAMAASALLAITILPILIGYFVRGKIRPEHKNPLNKMLIKLYKPLINGALNFPKTVIMLTVLIALTGAYPISKMGSEFMPELNEGDLLYMPSAFPGISIGKASEILQQTDRMIKTLPEVKTVFGKVGRAETATDPAPLTMIETTIQLKPKSEWRAGMTMEKIKQELDSIVNIPGMSNVWIMPIKNRLDMLATGIKTPVGIKVAGADLNVIAEIGLEIEKLLKDVEGTTSVYAERVASGRFIDIDINRHEAARHGLNISDVQSVIKTAVGGMKVTETVEGLERYPVNLRYPRDVRDSVEKLKMLPIITKNGEHIPLGDIAKVKIKDGAGMIRSENARINGWIYVDITDVDIGSYVKKAKKLVAENIDLPVGYSLAWAGQFEFMERAKSRMKIVVPVTLAIIILLLYLNFQSFAEVLIIMGTLPLALVGGFWLLYLLDYNMSVAVGVGFIALAGVAVEIGVLLLVYLNQSLKRQVEKVKSENREFTKNDLKTAVIEGALMRVLPIVMTVATIFAGLMTVMLGDGTGIEVMRRIAAPMVGGSISAIVLILLVIPAVYIIWKSKDVSTNNLNI